MTRTGERGVEDPELRPEVLAAVRRTVRSLLEENPEYQRAPPELRQGLASNMVKVSKRAAELVAEEMRLTEQLRRRRQPVARAQSAGDQLGLQAARSSGATVKELKDAIDFPNFVTSLISGVFQAITHSTLSQLESLGDLLDNVGKSTEEFTDANIDDAAAIAWALSKFGFLSSDANGLSLREGADLEQQAGPLKSALGASDDEISGIDPGDLAGTLLPLAKRKMGKSRQSNLATMVQLGLQRIVVDEGRLHASMELRVDTSSVSEEMKAQRDDMRVNAGASGSFGIGPWGASAKVDTSIGKVSSDTQYTKEQLESRAALRSSVDLAFRTEQIPLDRMADKDARVKLNLAARVPADVGTGLISSTTPQLTAPDFGPIPGAAAAPAAPPAPAAAPRPGGATPGAAAPTRGATAPPGQRGTPTPPAQAGAGAPGTQRGTTTQPGTATPPARPGAVAPAAQPGTATPPTQPGTVTPPAQPGTATAPARPGAVAPPTQPGTVTPPAQPGATTSAPTPGAPPPSSPAPATPAPAAQTPSAGSAVGSLVGGAVGSEVGAPAGAGSSIGSQIGSLVGGAFGARLPLPARRRRIPENRQ